MNRMKNMQEAGLTDLENLMDQAELASCHLINIKVAIDSLLLKQNSRMKMLQEIANKMKVETVLYH